MRLAEALQLLQGAPANRPSFPVALACGFTPLHLQTFLTAHLIAALPERTVEVRTGLFGDLAGTLERAPDADTAAVAVALEWADLDPRLGYRRLGGWGPAQQSEIGSTVIATLDRLQRAIENVPDGIPVAISLPTLPLAPAFHTAGAQASATELQVRAAVWDFASRIAIRASIAKEISAAVSGFDLRTDLLTGFPYTVPHASAVGESLACLIQPRPAKKGLITDLDNTLWNGIVGEIGADNVSWSGLHGLYQQLLQALAEQGVLIAVASKNERAVVEQAFARTDLLLRPSSVFPIEAHWEAKSKSVGRILETWNVGSDSVVFVDDNPMELAEVKAAWPEIECLEFPTRDYAAAEALLRKLRDLFGKARMVEEDALRAQSIRGAEQVRGQGGEESFLAEARAKMTIEFNPLSSDSRVLELVNKTNQFNLNGVRHTEVEWRRDLAEPGAFVMVVSYRDRFGPLGKIAVIKGRAEDGAVEMTTWVMSCRAFSRRIEHRCLEILFERFQAEEIRLQFASTPKNAPFREMVAAYAEAGPISRDVFFDRTPKLYQEVEFVQNSSSAASMSSHA